MRYELMRPDQIRAAIAANTPVVLPLGVLEYHGEHLPLGMDSLAVTRVFDRLEQTRELVILPAFPYGAASHAVRGPEGGAVHVGAEALVPFAEAMFYGLLRVGFRNIHAVIHHQTENFGQGMPTDLAFRLAGRQAVFKLIEGERGEGWWGNADNASYYEGHAAGDNPFNWVQVHPLMDQGVIDAFHFDHAGLGETALMLALAPETVDMEALAKGAPWYVAGAEAATAEEGERGVALILERLNRLLG
ncbi:creatininase family protein [Flavimaricola marinus]|uniref:Creatinine amidohydrolase n=1 Tax=Flavimaricola marinus TaxID=1819565 RepID=A0A238LJU7_9RHOB|nr:creatininase family protein [Flavimaricola marinus]SMY09902.1 Creatinine amidohydrolase [Flavimaricola marinus]